MANPLSTFCYLSAQRNAFGQLVDSQLAIEVALLRGDSNLEDDYNGDHDGDQKEAHTVDHHLQIGAAGRGVRRDSQMWNSVEQGGGEKQGELSWIS